MKVALSKKNLWEKLPPSLKSVVGGALSAVPLSWLLGRRFRRTLRFAEEAQWWPAERTRDYQLVQLRRVLGIAYENTPFYRRAFESVGFEPGDLQSMDDLAGLPTIDRHDLVGHLAEMCAIPPDAPGVDEVSTGGTSGVPLKFYIGSGRSAVEYAYLVSGWQRCGFRLGMPMAVFRGRVVGEDTTGLRHEYDPLLRHHYYSNFHMTEEMMGRYIEHVRGLGPCFLHVYPSSVTALARFLLRSGRDAPTNVHGIIAESEIVYPEQRQIVETVFGCRIFSGYGHTEKLVAAAECEHTSDDHVWGTYGFCELLDEQGKPVTTPGERGEIVGTGFINAVVPFVRYRTGDMATYVGTRCDVCGREALILREIRGHRTQEVLIASDGAEISWTAMNMHDDTFDRVREFQFRQDQPGLATLRIVPAEGFGQGDRERIDRNLGAKFDGRLDVSYEIVDEIARSAQGKAVYVDQRIRRDAPSDAASLDG